MLDVNDLRKRYDTPQGPLRVLDGVSMHLPAGQSLALMGESGCGKSTFLHVVAGLDSADGGTVTVDGDNVTAMDDSARAALRRDRVGLIFQQFNLIPSLTVRDNLSFQARLAGRLDRDWLDRLSGRLDLGGLMDRYPEHLSGGQQQRVAIGRTFAARPSLVLADEPTGNLDEATSDSVMALSLELVRETGCALLVVTHSDRLAAAMDRTLRLSGGRLDGGRLDGGRPDGERPNGEPSQ